MQWRAGEEDHHIAHHQGVSCNEVQGRHQEQPGNSDGGAGDSAPKVGPQSQSSRTGLGCRLGWPLLNAAGDPAAYYGTVKLISLPISVHLEPFNE